MTEELKLFKWFLTTQGMIEKASKEEAREKTFVQK
jgi:hypothetical protein